MKVVRISEIQEEPMASATPVAGWTGETVGRTRQPVLPPELSGQFACGVVNFSRGATTGWHTHTGDQILVITSGRGRVATEQAEYDVAAGDVVYIPAGENHLHGATEASTMSHLTVVSQDKQPGSG